MSRCFVCLHTAVWSDAGRLRRARFRGGGEDEPVSLHVRRSALRRDEVQAEAERGTGRGGRHCRHVQLPLPPVIKLNRTST